MARASGPLVVFITGAVWLAGCGQKADTNPAPGPATPAKEKLIDVLGAINAEPGLTDEQALQKYCQAISTRGKELLLLDPMPEGAKLVPADGGGWTIEAHVRDRNEVTTYGTAAQAEMWAEQQTLATKKGMASLATDLLEKGKAKSLKAVRISAYTPVKVKAKAGKDEEKTILAYRVRATQADHDKIIGWWLWPNFRPPGYGGANKDKLEADMWTVEVNEYPKIHAKKS
jgi:hypothetical protein